MFAYNRHYYQFDIYFGCHDTSAIIHKNIHGYILKNTDNHQLEISDIITKDCEVDQRPQHKT